MPSVGRPWSRTGKSASRSNRVPAAPTRSCCERQPITTCTGDANRASRIAETEVGATASLRLTSNTGRRRCAPDGRRRPTRPQACLLTTAPSGVGHRARQPWERGRSRSPQLRAAGSPRGDFGPCDPWPAHQHGRCMPVRTSSGSAANRRGRGRVRTGGAHVPARDPGCPRPMAGPIGARVGHSWSPDAGYATGSSLA